MTWSAHSERNRAARSRPNAVRMAAERALVCATSEAANLVGLADQVGSVAVGKQADLIVVDGNPLDDIAVVERGVTLVMKGGRLARDAPD